MKQTLGFNPGEKFNYVAQWIRPQTLTHELHGSNPLAEAVSVLRQGCTPNVYRLV